MKRRSFLGWIAGGALAAVLPAKVKLATRPKEIFTGSIGRYSDMIIIGTRKPVFDADGFGTIGIDTNLESAPGEPRRFPKQQQLVAYINDGLDEAFCRAARQG